VTEQPATKSSGLAIAALVCSLLMCVPIFPLLGIVLGIVVMVKARQAPGRPGEGLGIAAIAVGAVGIIVSLGVSSALAIPAFISYIRNAKIAEAETELSVMARQAQAYHDEHGRFPDTTPVTPEISCAESPDGRCRPGPGDWSHPTWQALGFSMRAPHYFQYQFVNGGSDYTVRAHADLDADGIMSTFERSGAVATDGTVHGPTDMISNLPSE
jgi:hypothetical protein